MIAFSHLSEWCIIIFAAFATMFKIMETLDGEPHGMAKEYGCDVVKSLCNLKSHHFAALCSKVKAISIMAAMSLYANGFNMLAH